MSDKIKITIRNGEENAPYRLLHTPGKTLLETMREGAVLLPSLCGGTGKCGRCMVRFGGYAPLPTATDRSIIAPDKLREGYRLACMARPGRDCTVEAEFAEVKAAEEGKLHVVTGYYAADGRGTEKGNQDEKRTEEENAGSGTRTVAAADIGTTTIAMQSVDISSGCVLDTYTCLNPQRSYGADVISRIRAAGEGHGERLKELVRNVLSCGLEQLRESAKGRGRKEPDLLCIACNTAMGHIFMGYPAETLGKSPFLPVETGMNVVEWEGMDVVVMPGASAFVGGDIVAGLYACGLMDLDAAKDEAWLFMDLGTNAEMVMGTGRRMVATAAAAGPAFEGRGTDGVTGAERIHAIADLLERGIVDENGLLADPYFEEGVDVEIAGRAENGMGIRGQAEMAGREGDKTRMTGREKNGRKVRVTQEDIRAVQMAKAAVRAGIHFLTKKLGMEDCGRIKRVYIAGGMGFYLDRKAAARIGLLPAELALKAQTVGNTALAGACLLGREDWRKKGRELERIAGSMEVLQMAELAEFSDIYIGYMGFDCNIPSGMV